MYKTYQPSHKGLKIKTHTLDAKGRILGRFATEVARLLMGKHKSTYSNNIDVGDRVIVINAAKIKLSGNKAKQKVYRHHSGYPGGFKEIPFEKMFKEHPERVIEIAVSGMLPDNRLKARRMVKLKIEK